jgi:hypothetical protein
LNWKMSRAGALGHASSGIRPARLRHRIEQEWRKVSERDPQGSSASNADAKNKDRHIPRGTDEHAPDSDRGTDQADGAHARPDSGRDDTSQSVSGDERANPEAR